MVPDKEQRREERVPAAFSVALDGTTGVTRDISPSGIFFEADASYVPGSQAWFTVDVDTPGGKMRVACQGDIVRVERTPARVGVAVRITEWQIRPAAAASPG